MSLEVKDFLQRAADRNGFVREMCEERKLPGDVDRLCVLPFFGDLRSAFVLSSLLLKRYREEVKGSKYFILCSWPGHGPLYPYVDEYWSIGDSHLRSLYVETDGLSNRSDLATVHVRNLNEFFRDVANLRELSPYYDHGITQAFWEKFRHVKRTLPMVPSSAILGKDFNRQLAQKPGYKVFIFPHVFARTWKMGRTRHTDVPKAFWEHLVKALLDEKFVPVLWKHPLSYDLSPDFPEECVHIQDMDLGRVLGVMRAVGCVLDVFNGTSRLALAARTPFLACDERSRFMAVKEYEVDDLCGTGVPRQYIFSFSTIISGEHGSWDDNLFRNIVARLNDFLPGLDRDRWPTTAEGTEIVAYDTVRKYKSKKIGAKLLKIPRE